MEETFTAQGFVPAKLLPQNAFLFWYNLCFPPYRACKLNHLSLGGLGGYYLLDRITTAFADRPSANNPIGLTDQAFFEKFNRDFAAISADDAPLLKLALKIRYQVYCIENAFEPSAEHPGGFESDEFDRHSAHSLIINRATGQPLGTVRLILPRADHCYPSLPVYGLCDDAALDCLPRYSTAEVSRFSLSKQLRKRHAIEDRSLSPMPRLGLIQALVRMSVYHQITHWCAVMEPSLLRVLAAMGIHFQPIGPPIEYHGLRQPSFCCVAEMLARARGERPAFWDVITDGGLLYDRLLPR